MDSILFLNTWFIIFLVSYGISLCSANEEGKPSEINYGVNETLTLNCLTSVLEDGTPLYVNWFLEDKLIRGEEGELNNFLLVSTDVHQNTIKLRSTLRQDKTRVVHCTMKGDYEENFVNIYYLKMVTRGRPEDILARGDHLQKCPLYANLTLILDCAAAFRYMNAGDLFWKKDDDAINYANYMNASKPGNYRCYRSNHRQHQRRLISVVVQPKKPPPRILPEWVLCQYKESSGSRAAQEIPRVSYNHIHQSAGVSIGTGPLFPALMFMVYVVLVF